MAIVRTDFRFILAKNSKRDQRIAAWIDAHRDEFENVSELVKRAIWNEYIEPPDDGPNIPRAPRLDGVAYEQH